MNDESPTTFMLARDIISPLIPALHPLDTASKALRLLNEYHVAQLPLVDESQYLGLVDESVLLDWDSPEQSLRSFHQQYVKPAVQAGSHFFEALKLINDFKLSLMPVLEEQEYIGVITHENLLHTLSGFDEIQIPGAILMLEVDPRDYSLTMLARLSEASEVSLLGIHLLNDPGSGKMNILLKTNRQNLVEFIAMLEQSGYSLQYQFGETIGVDTLRKNYDLLMNYINM